MAGEITAAVGIVEIASQYGPYVFLMALQYVYTGWKDYCHSKTVRAMADLIDKLVEKK